jgi:N12 class adenine-specific DNA methylase
VGAGKSFEMAAAGMKMKQAGLIHKPMFVVPNHMLARLGGLVAGARETR